MDPTVDDVMEIIKKMWNGIAPETDQIVIELYKAMFQIMTWSHYQMHDTRHMVADHTGTNLQKPELDSSDNSDDDIVNSNMTAEQRHTKELSKQ